jgi:sterol-4alpha-carboxylate 3-dehydrogenase (decarboxylating)
MAKDDPIAGFLSLLDPIFGPVKAGMQSLEHVLAPLAPYEKKIYITLGLGLLTFVIENLYRAMRLPKPYSLKLSRDVDKRSEAIKYPSYELPEGILITGGCGFLGENLIRALETQKGVKRIIAFDLFTRPISTDARVEVIKGDLNEPGKLEEILKSRKIGCVIHTASPHPNSRNKELFEAVNVRGTQAVIDACKSVSGCSLIYTSSASVIWQGESHAGVNETDTPYPTVFRDAYAETKARAEKLVMRAGDSSLITISLRPHGIFGPGDRQMVPTLVDVAKSGRNKFIVGAGDNLVDFTYVGNVVHAHMLAAQAAYVHWNGSGKTPGAKSGKGCASNGKTYFITNGQPLPMWNMLNNVWLGLGYDSAVVRIPYNLILTIAFIAEFFTGLWTRLTGRHVELQLSSSRLQITGTTHFYSIANAVKDLEYGPLWDMEAGLFLTLKSFKNERNKAPSRLTTSKARAGNLIALGLIDDLYLHELREGKGSDVGKVGGASAAVGARLSRRRAAAEALKNGGEASLEEIQMSEVVKHDRKDDVWLAIDGRVYDLTDYIDNHPGGDSMLKFAGKDATDAFYGPQHPSSTRDLVRSYVIGRLARK